MTDRYLPSAASCDAYAGGADNADTPALLEQAKSQTMGSHKRSLYGYTAPATMRFIVRFEDPDRCLASREAQLRLPPPVRQNSRVLGSCRVEFSF